MTTPPRPPVLVTWDELQAPEVSARVEQLRAAGAPPLVRAVGAPPSSTTSVLRNGIVTLGIAGVVGGLVGWALSELITNTRAPEGTSHWYGDSDTAGAIVFVLFIALGLGGVLSAVDGLEARSLQKAWQRLRLALPVLAVGGVVGGYLAQKLYESRIDAAIKDASDYFDATGDTSGAFEQLQGAVHLSRGLGFALLGLAIGLALGLSSRSKQRAINGAIGGVVGGGVGGYVFDYVDLGDSGAMNRLVAIVITGAVIGLAVGLVEQVRRELWLEIVSGGMAGKQFILYNDATVVGAGPSCDITLIKDPQIVDRHLLLSRSGSTTRATAATPGVPFLLNGQPVLESTLTDGDTVQVGSTVLRLRAKSASAPVAGPILG